MLRIRIEVGSIKYKLNIAKLHEDEIKSRSHFNILKKGNDVLYQDKILRASDYAFKSWHPHSVIICGDNEMPSKLTPYINNIDLLVHEATFTHSDIHRVGTHTGHSDAKSIAKFETSTQLNA